jgi:hypothetical protein
MEGIYESNENVDENEKEKIAKSMIRRIFAYENLDISLECLRARNNKINNEIEQQRKKK